VAERVLVIHQIISLLLDVDCIEHIVKAGETLSSIAKKYNTTFQKIAADNGIINPNAIKVGQKLRIF